jgi:Cell morphogenesis C-terminal
LERGPTGMQGAVLSILHCLLHYVDFNVSSSAQQVNADLLRVIAKYIEVITFTFHYQISYSINKFCAGNSLERSAENIEISCNSFVIAGGASFVLQQWHLGIRFECLFLFRFGIVPQERIAWADNGIHL